MTLLCKCPDSTFCPTPAYIWTVVVVNDISYIYVYHVRLGRELIFNTEQKNSISFCQEKIIRQCCVAFFLTICGYLLCFWVSHQAVVLYSFFWWLRLTNFWSRTRTQAIFGQKKEKLKQGYFEHCVETQKHFYIRLHNFNCFGHTF